MPGNRHAYFLAMSLLVVMRGWINHVRNWSGFGICCFHVCLQYTTDFKFPQCYLVLRFWIIFQRVLPQCTSPATALAVAFALIPQRESSFLFLPLLQQQKFLVTGCLVALARGPGDSVFLVQPLSYILCPWVSGTELSKSSCFFPSDGGSLTAWIQDDFLYFPRIREHFLLPFHRSLWVFIYVYSGVAVAYFLSSRGRNFVPQGITIFKNAETLSDFIA